MDFIHVQGDRMVAYRDGVLVAEVPLSMQWGLMMQKDLLAWMLKKHGLDQAIAKELAEKS